MRRLTALAIALVIASPFSSARGQSPDSVAAVDRIFAGWTSRATPGCAVGVARDGRAILERAYGMANLEYDAPNTAETIFEAGSVSKQFTATAVVLLALDGKLALDDPIRKYLPELPAVDQPITIRHMLHHISGLRDWGVVAAAAGWPRGSRAHTQAHVLDIMSRQHALNYPVGSEYLYSNSNYNLSAMIVERVSGMPFSEFTRKRIFEPLGMTSTSWRDDYTRVVKGRSTAYSSSGAGPWRLDMPFENAHGNGGLLTTVDDLLKWNQNFVTSAVGGAALLNELQQRGRLTNGRDISYALGLVVDDYRGVPEISHTGATGGYRAFLARYPRQKLSVALLCNVGNANPGGLGHRIADVFLGNDAQPATQAGANPVQLTNAQLERFAGVWRNERTHEPVKMELSDGALRSLRGRLSPLNENTLLAPQSARWELVTSEASPARARLVSADGDTAFYARETAWNPTASQLQSYAGTYTSDDAEATFTLAVKDGKLVATSRPDRTAQLTPMYRDGFTTPDGNVVWFHRDARGRVVAASLGMGRVRDLWFERGQRTR
jgi:CubicO group peptidase (beta-lactamase class C family)